MRFFAAVYRERSIMKAAERVNVVPSAVSQQILRIERAYEITLFERTKDGLIPTATAERLYPLCVKIIEDADRLQLSLQASSGRIAGCVRVGIQSTASQLNFGQLLVAFKDMYPDVEVQVREGFSAGLVQGLDRGDFDFVVLSQPELPVDLDSMLLTSQDLAVITNAETKRGIDVIRGADLKDVKLVLPSRSNLLRALLDRQFALYGIEIVPTLEVDSLPCIHQIAAQPGWVTITVPDNFLFDRNLRSIRLIEPKIKRLVFLAWRKGSKQGPAVQLFIEQIAQRFGSHLHDT